MRVRPAEPTLRGRPGSTVVRVTPGEQRRRPRIRATRAPAGQRDERTLPATAAVRRIRVPSSAVAADVLGVRRPQSLPTRSIATPRGPSPRPRRPASAAATGRRAAAGGRRSQQPGHGAPTTTYQPVPENSARAASAVGGQLCSSANPTGGVQSHSPHDAGERADRGERSDHDRRPAQPGEGLRGGGRASVTSRHPGPRSCLRSAKRAGLGVTRQVVVEPHHPRRVTGQQPQPDLGGAGVSPRTSLGCSTTGAVTGSTAG